MSSAEDILSVVRDDIRYLRTNWWRDMADADLRRGSTVVRRLLVDGELQRAWKAAGFTGQPLVQASSLSGIITQVPLQRIAFASAGGARFKGLEVRGAIVINYAMTLREIQELQAEGMPDEMFRLRDYVEAPAVIVESQKIPRRVVIKYIANKLGGAHHDPRRGRGLEEHMFRLLDKAATIQVAEKKAVYFELLSAGQAVVSSHDIVQLCPDGDAA